MFSIWLSFSTWNSGRFDCKWWELIEEGRGYKGSENIEFFKVRKNNWIFYFGLKTSLLFGLSNRQLSGKSVLFAIIDKSCWEVYLKYIEKVINRKRLSNFGYCYWIDNTLNTLLKLRCFLSYDFARRKHNHAYLSMYFFYSLYLGHAWSS